MRVLESILEAGYLDVHSLVPKAQASLTWLGYTQSATTRHIRTSDFTRSLCRSRIRAVNLSAKSPHISSCVNLQRNPLQQRIHTLNTIQASH